MVSGEDAFFGGGDDDDILRLGGLVDRGDGRAKLGRARRLRVAEPLTEQPVGSAGLECEQIPDGDRLGVARGEHVRRRELVDRVVLLDPKRSDLQAIIAARRNV